MTPGEVMRCPYCSNNDTQVKDSRPSEDGSAIRRRRHCPECSGRFTHLREGAAARLQVVKRSGRRVPFDRDKLIAFGPDRAAPKRPVDPDRVERMVSTIIRQLESTGGSDIPAQTIGNLVMEGLRDP